MSELIITAFQLLASGKGIIILKNKLAPEFLKFDKVSFFENDLKVGNPYSRVTLPADY